MRASIASPPICLSYPYLHLHLYLYLYLYLLTPISYLLFDIDTSLQVSLVACWSIREGRRFTTSETLVLKQSLLKVIRAHYRYVIVVVGFFVGLLTWGGYNSLGVFILPIISEMEWTRGSISGAYSFAFLVSGFSSLLAGRLSDSAGPRAVCAATGIFLGIGFLLASRVQSMWQFYLAFGLVGMGLSGEMSSLPVLTRWFSRTLGLVTGIAKSGVGIGIMVVPVLAASLIVGLGWRVAFAIIGGVTAAGMVVASLLLRRDPSQVGLPPGGTPLAPPGDKVIVGPPGADQPIVSREVSPITSRMALKTGRFWTYASIMLLTSVVTRAVITHFAPHMVDLGIDASEAARLLGAVGGFSLLGRLGLGAAADKLGVFRVQAVTLALMTASLAWLQFASSRWSFFLFAVAYGVAHGAYFTLFSPLVARLFGSFAAGAILGMFAFIGTLGGSAGPLLAGYTFDITGSYGSAFFAFLLMSLGALALGIVLMRGVRELG